MFRGSRIRDVKVLDKSIANDHTDIDSIIIKCFNSDNRKYEYKASLLAGDKSIC